VHQRRREATAKNSISPKVYRREGYLATVQIKPVMLLLLRARCGAAGSDQGTTIKHLGQTKSGTAGNGLGTTI
jgi:hypothetical protein